MKGASLRGGCLLGPLDTNSSGLEEADSKLTLRIKNMRRVDRFPIPTRIESWHAIQEPADMLNNNSTTLSQELRRRWAQIVAS